MSGNEIRERLLNESAGSAAGDAMATAATATAAAAATAPTGASAHKEAPNRGFIFHSPITVKTSNRKVTLAAIIACVAALAIIAIAGALLMPVATQSDLAIKNLAPSLDHWFGTDRLGRDMFTRTISGLSVSIGIGLLAAVVSSVIALVLGTAAALGGKKVDTAVTWLTDLMLSIPHIVLLILISFALGKGFVGVTVGVAITHWPSLCRVVRAEVLQVKQSRYVAVARQLGQSRVRIAITHVLPAVFPQFLTGLILLFPHAILHEAAITFLGFGLPAEMPAIGVILSEAMNYLSAGMWWLAVFPGIALIIVVMLFDVAGQCVRRMVDPHQAQR